MTDFIFNMHDIYVLFMQMRVRNVDVRVCVLVYDQMSQYPFHIRNITSYLLNNTKKADLQEPLEREESRSTAEEERKSGCAFVWEILLLWQCCYSLLFSRNSVCGPNWMLSVGFSADNLIFNFILAVKTSLKRVCVILLK